MAAIIYNICDAFYTAKKIKIKIKEHLPAYSLHMRGCIVKYQKEPRIHYTSGKSDNGSKIFILTPNESQGVVTVEFCEYPHGYAFPAITDPPRLC